MKWEEILKRLKGLQILGCGGNWEFPDSHQTIARRLITFLEDRRVLYSDWQPEVSNHCVGSVLLIRKTLNDEILKLNTKCELENSMRAMCAACRKFLDTVQVIQDENGNIEIRQNSVHIFNGALGELRGIFGIYIAALASKYKIDVEDSLTSIFPSGDQEGY